MRMVFDQKEPVAAPGHIAMHDAMSRHIDRDMGAIAIGGDIRDRYFAIRPQRNLYVAYGSLKSVHSHPDSPQVHQRSGHADGSMPAHAEIARVVEEDHAGRCVAADRLYKQCAHQHVRAARLQQNRPAIDIMLRAHALQPFSHGAAAQLRAPRDYATRRLPRGV